MASLRASRTNSQRAPSPASYPPAAEGRPWSGMDDRHIELADQPPLPHDQQHLTWSPRPRQEQNYHTLLNDAENFLPPTGANQQQHPSDLYLFEIWSSQDPERCTFRAETVTEEEARQRLGLEVGLESGAGSPVRYTRILFVAGRHDSGHGYFPLKLSQDSFTTFSQQLAIPSIMLESLFLEEPIVCEASRTHSGRPGMSATGYILQIQDNNGSRYSLSCMSDYGDPYRTNMFVLGLSNERIHKLELEIKAQDLTTWSAHSMSMTLLWNEVLIGMERLGEYTTKQQELQAALGIDDYSVLQRDPLSARRLPEFETMDLASLTIFLTALSGEWSWVHREFMGEIRALEFIQDYILAKKDAAMAAAQSLPNAETGSVGTGPSSPPPPRGSANTTSSTHIRRGQTATSDAYRRGASGPVQHFQRHNRPGGGPMVASSSAQTSAFYYGDSASQTNAASAASTFPPPPRPSYDPADDDVLDRARMLASLLRGASDYCTSFQRGEESFRQTIYSLIAQRDNIAMQAVANASARDSSAMVVISALSAIFLPATFAATFFSTTFFDFQAKEGEQVVSWWWWLYPVVTAGLTGLIAIAWVLWEKRRNVKRKNEFMGMRAMTKGVTLESQTSTAHHPVRASAPHHGRGGLGGGKSTAFRRFAHRAGRLRPMRKSAVDATVLPLNGMGPTSRAGIGSGNGMGEIGGMGPTVVGDDGRV